MRKTYFRFIAYKYYIKAGSITYKKSDLT